MKRFKIKKHLIFKGWGRKLSGKRAVLLSRIFNSSFLLKEDGFIRSIERNGPLLSFAEDSKSIFYDSQTPSDLEDLIKSEITDFERSRLSSILNLYKSNSISKYNGCEEYVGVLPKNYILLIDQVYGDLSVKYGMASSSSFRHMLNCALNDYPDFTIVVKVHPDVFSREKKGYFNIHELTDNPRIKIIAESCHPVRLICQSKAVYVVTSQVGFEALIWRKKVKVFGMPFYAGWGQTEDALGIVNRRIHVSLEQLLYAVLVKYPKYINPITKEISTIEETIKHIGLQKRMRRAFPRKIYAYKFSLWKKPILKKFVQGSKVKFIKKISQIPKGGSLILWGSKEIKGLDESIKIYRVEDGFLRSVGLGADFTKPLSWVFDKDGIYYDYSKPSQLERILEKKDFDADELDRAEALRQSIVQQKISKYNLGDSNWVRPCNHQSVLLVIGQVEEDASIRFGTNLINTNAKLLKKVRENHPDSYILYKPHPDIVAGLRPKSIEEGSLDKYYDFMIKEGDAIALFDQVDSIHTMTSLVGFEAIIRGKLVYCYGMPFYAGWGLTKDYMSINRRKRKLCIKTLVAGVLINYPTYVSHDIGEFISAESAIKELVHFKKTGVKPLNLWRKILRDLVKLFKHSLLIKYFNKI
jgi:capsular polysaccharide export protein